MSDTTGATAEKFGVCFFPTRNAAEVAEVAKLCEDRGLGFLGVGDVHELWADSYVSLALAAAATTRIHIGPWVTNPLTRHPTVTANAIATLNDLSAGRAFLGIGVGDGAVRLIGGRPATLAGLAEAIALIKERMQVSRDGIQRKPVPVYWAAAGEKSTREGALHGDGVIISGWITPELLRESIDAIAEGAAGRGPVLPIFNTSLVIDDDSSRALAVAKPYVARALARPSSARVAGWTLEDVERFREAYNFQRHFRSDHELGQLVPDELVAKKAIAGTPAECAAQIRQIFDAGFERIAVIPMGDVNTAIRRLADDVLPLLGGDSR
jgi:alkanesulfonate monooxygenase SsuD/methylene tetrahydromethanopterin reductase-like flavin-dependent oxidoreductase (luciferase family)